MELDQALEAATILDSIPIEIRLGSGAAAVIITVNAAPMNSSNEEFGEVCAEVTNRPDRDTSKIGPGGLFTMDESMEIFCRAILRGWDLTQAGKKIPIEDAFQIYASGKAGRQLLIDILSGCGNLRDLNRFRANVASKKKPSSSSTPPSKNSVQARRRSSPRPKPGAGPSRQPSPTT